MAKVSGPLFSVEASGAYAGSLVFAKWKGRQYARQLVIPANPRSLDQETARNAMRVAGSAQKFANANSQVRTGLSLADKAEITAKTPAGYAWNGFLVDSIIGAGGVNIAASDALWAGLSGAEQTAWTTAADALTAPLFGVNQTGAGGVPATAKPSGQVFFNYTYGLYAMGLVAVPGAVPPTYV